MGEAVDVDSAVYCWRRSVVFWRMRASLGLAYPSSAPPGGCSLLISLVFFALSARAWRSSDEIRSLQYHTPRLCRIAVFLIQTIVLSCRAVI